MKTAEALADKLILSGSDTGKSPALLGPSTDIFELERDTTVAQTFDISIANLTWVHPTWIH